MLGGTLRPTSTVIILADLFRPHTSGLRRANFIQTLRHITTCVAWTLRHGMHFCCFLSSSFRRRVVRSSQSNLLMLALFFVSCMSMHSLSDKENDASASLLAITRLSLSVKEPMPFRTFALLYQSTFAQKFFTQEICLIDWMPFLTKGIYL